MTNNFNLPFKRSITSYFPGLICLSSFKKNKNSNIISDVKFLSSLNNDFMSVTEYPKLNKDNYKEINKNDFSLVKGSYEYLRSIAKYRNLNWNSRSHNDWSHFKLGCIYFEEEFKENLINFLNSLQPHQSYSILFDCVSDEGVISLDKSYLINNDTNPDSLILAIKRILEDKAFKYGVDVYSYIAVRYAGISIKVKNPVFRDNAITRKMLTDKKISHRFLSNKYVPFTMEYDKYSIITNRYKNDRNQDVIVYNYNNKLLHVVKDLDLLENFVEIYDSNNNLIDSFIDSKVDDYFIRKVSGIYFKIAEERIIFEESPINVKFNSVNVRTRKDYILNDKILTLDIETFSNDCIPYACGVYDGKNVFTFYLTDFNSIDEMVIACFNKVLSPEYDGYYVYVHNLAKFDGKILFKILLEYFDIKPLAANKDAIFSYSMKKVNEDNKTTKITLKDSIRVLPNSLRKLGKSFGVKTLKGVFPYKFVDENKLLYNGKIPDYSFYNEEDIKLSEYFNIKNEYNNTNWNLKEETLKYLNGDLISLYEVLIKYINEVYKDHKLNVVNVVSISSLSSKIFYSDYYKDIFELPILTGTIEKFHRQAFYGGLSDVIRPYANENIKSYDFVSMYPGIMKSMPFPTGNPIFTTNKNLNELFGVVKAKIQAPPLPIPTLPLKVNGRVITPTGNWEGVYCTEILKKVQEFGYKIEVIYGYTYKKTYGIFNDFVSDKFLIKNTSEGARREIAKLTMNSLFGFTGRHSYNQITEIVTKDERDKIESIYPVFDYFYIKNKDKYYIRYSSIPDKMKCEQSGNDYEMLLLESNKKRFDLKEISLPTAIFIAAYGVCKLSDILINNSEHILNYDTDGLKTTKELVGNMMGTDLGELKEDVKDIQEIYCIAPKFYAMKLKNEKYIFKGKSIKNKNLRYEDYINLYNDINVTKIEERWYSKVNTGKVLIKDLPIELSPELTKRKKVYSLGKWVKTDPFHVENGEITSTDLVKLNN